MFSVDEIVYIPAFEKLGYVVEVLENNEYRLRINGEVITFINFLEAHLKPIKFTKAQQKKIDNQVQQQAKELCMEHFAILYIRKNSEAFKQFKKEQKTNII